MKEGKEDRGRRGEENRRKEEGRREEEEKREGGMERGLIVKPYVLMLTRTSVGV